MSLDENLSDLVRHREEFEERSAFAYSILEDDEVVGCLYIDADETSDALVMSWVRADRAELDPRVRRWVSEWLATEWPFDELTYEA